jgi:A/G-specific adenine glycosylase
MAARNRISKPLLAWYDAGHRKLPWRGTTDPYRIWISEVMLQQTRAQAVIPYYERFLCRFPMVESLAASAEEEVLTLWAGLGYYSRARNLRKAALEIVEAGGFPRDCAGLRALPGIGDYTAAAIASIAFAQPHAALDGNVLRVVARIENDASDIGAALTRERFRAVAQSWLDIRRPGPFNQAMMELGATVCLPKNPSCAACPLANRCGARAAGTASQLPVKLKRIQPISIEDMLLVVRRGGRILLRQRERNATRMAGFWDLPTPTDLPDAQVQQRLGEIRHTITHHRYRFIVAAAEGRVPANGYRWFRAEEMQNVPLSTTARKALSTIGLLAYGGAERRVSD